MARARLAKHPRPAEPEDESQEAPEETGGFETHGKVTSKADAVRAAVAEGIDTPDEGVAFIKSRFGIEMAKPMWSSYRSQEKARQKKQAGGAAPKKPGRKPAVEGYLAPPPKQPANGGEADLLVALEAIKPLVASLGAEKVKRIVDLLG